MQHVGPPQLASVPIQVERKDMRSHFKALLPRIMT